MKQSPSVRPGSHLFYQLRHGDRFACQVKPHRPLLEFEKTGMRQAVCLNDGRIFWFAAGTQVESRPASLPVGRPRSEHDSSKEPPGSAS